MHFLNPGSKMMAAFNLQGSGACRQTSNQEVNTLACVDE